MSIETVQMKTRDGRTCDAELEIHRYALPTRLVRSVPIFVTSVVVGGLSILVPAVHLISTWFIPLLGTGIALYIFRIEAKLGDVSGCCPDCQESFTQPGGPYENPIWVRCPRCSIPLQVMLPE